MRFFRNQKGSDTVAKRIPYYPVLEAELSKKRIKKKDLAKTLNLSERAFSVKIRGKNDFWLREALIIHKLFPDILIERLFGHERS